MAASLDTRLSLVLPAVLALVVVTLTVVTFGTGTASATDTCSKFAAPTGSDSAAGTQAAPYRTPQQLADSLSSGQTGCLRNGTYVASSHYSISFRHGGESGAPITIRSYPGERARLIGIVHVPNGANHVTISDLIIEGTGESNTVKIYSADVIVEESEITNAWRGLSCMMLGSSSAGLAVRTMVRGNVFHACGSLANGNKDHAIYAAGTVYGEIVDNIFYDTAAYTIQFYPNAQGTRFAHNVIDGGSPSIRGGVIFGSDGSTAARNNVVEENVISYATTYNVLSSWDGEVGSGNVARDNCLWAGGGGDLHNSGGLTTVGNLSANPNFVDRARHDYRLAPGSPCLAKVGYDTAAKLADLTEPDASPQPEQPEPDPQSTLQPTPTPTPAPAPEAEPTQPTPTKSTASRKQRGNAKTRLRLRRLRTQARRRAHRQHHRHPRTRTARHRAVRARG